MIGTPFYLTGFGVVISRLHPRTLDKLPVYLGLFQNLSTVELTPQDLVTGQANLKAVAEELQVGQS